MNKPITAYDERNPFAEYNMSYELALKGGSLSSFIRSSKLYIQEPEKALEKIASMSGGNKRKVIKQKRKRISLLQKIARKINR